MKYRRKVKNALESGDTFNDDRSDIDLIDLSVHSIKKDTRSKKKIYPTNSKIHTKSKNFDTEKSSPGCRGRGNQ
jgi:hypothetical protein